MASRRSPWRWPRPSCRRQTLRALSILLSSVTSRERAHSALLRAMQVSGLSAAPALEARELHALLDALAAEDTPIRDVAQQIAALGLESIFAGATLRLTPAGGPSAGTRGPSAA